MFWVAKMRVTHLLVDVLSKGGNWLQIRQNNQRVGVGYYRFNFDVLAPYVILGEFIFRSNPDYLAMFLLLVDTVVALAIEKRVDYCLFKWPNSKPQIELEMIRRGFVASNWWNDGVKYRKDFVSVIAYIILFSFRSLV